MGSRRFRKVQTSNANSPREVFKHVSSPGTVNLVRDELTPSLAYCVYAYVGTERDRGDKKINTISSTAKTLTDSLHEAKCYYAHEAGVGSEEEEWGSDEENDKVHVMRLNPGERRGWWKERCTKSERPSIALVHGAVCDRRTTILLDSGASTSIISLDLARELRLPLDQTTDLAVKGMGGVTTKIKARAEVKVTLGHRLVYYVNVWVGNIGGGMSCLLGMDFMQAAGVRLNVHEGQVCLPDEETVPLAQPGGGYVRKPLEHRVNVTADYGVPKRGSIVIPIDYQRVKDRKSVV